MERQTEPHQAEKLTLTERLEEQRRYGREAAQEMSKLRSRALVAEAEVACLRAERDDEAASAGHFKAQRNEAAADAARIRAELDEMLRSRDAIYNRMKTAEAERDEARASLEREAQAKNAQIKSAQGWIRQRDEWKRRAEAAEASDGDL